MNIVKVSVRNLVEFILRDGSITSSSGIRDPEAMWEGSRIHKKIQAQEGGDYIAEARMSVTLPASYDGIDFQICVEGRADGIFFDDTGANIDEIKGVYRDLSVMEAPAAVHRGQALCYGYIYAAQNSLDEIGIRMTYCNIPTEELRYFKERISFENLKTWFFGLIGEYAKWAAWRIKWDEERNASIKDKEFPFEYRKGQSRLVKGAYQSIIRKKRLYIEAPTGVGKTISVVFPAVKAMGEGAAEKIFYLTAKTVTAAVARNALEILSKGGMRIKYAVITAKEKICVLDKPRCGPATCEMALGHYSRINDAVYDVITHEDAISRDVVVKYAKKHGVCPFEMCLDVAEWVDVVIGDYNYVFDPRAGLRRFFGASAHGGYVFLIDEAHNLVDRAREMYSAEIIKEDFLEAGRAVKGVEKKLEGALRKCNRELLEMKRECGGLKKYSLADIEGLILKLSRLAAALGDFFQDHLSESRLEGAAHDVLLNFYFNVSNFIRIYEIADDRFLTYARIDRDGSFRLRLRCMDPGANLDECLNRARSAIFFSATLLPIRYYMEQLGGREDDYAIYAPSPFPAKNRLVLVGTGVSTKYDRRNAIEYEKIARYIYLFAKAKPGNYMAFFSSYKLMEDVSKYIYEVFSDDEEVNICMQSADMDEDEREKFLSRFKDGRARTLGLCVMGGIFGEGIDLKNDRLIGAIIVGVGLPMVCEENEICRKYFDEAGKSGFDYAYRYPGMNKVLQAAGRVIRTDDDKGAILLLDERFLQRGYKELFPYEWRGCETATQENLSGKLKKFWAAPD